MIKVLIFSLAAAILCALLLSILHKFNLRVFTDVKEQRNQNADLLEPFLPLYS